MGGWGGEKPTLSRGEKGTWVKGKMEEEERKI
jgi:hypothetical protein